MRSPLTLVKVPILPLFALTFALACSVVPSAQSESPRTETSWVPSGSNGRVSKAEAEQIRQLHHDAALVREKTGVAVVLQLDADRDFSAPWRAMSGGRSTQIALEEALRYLPIIETFLNAYPRTLVRYNLKRIVLAKNLEFEGKGYGGTYSESTIFVTSKGESLGYDDAFLLDLLHAEFSSILLTYYPDLFARKRWLKANEASWNYEGSGVEMLGTTGLFRQTRSLLKRGFLTPYSTSSLENDFNTVTKWLLTRPAALAKLCAKHPRLAKKSRVVRDFYRALGLDV